MSLYAATEDKICPLSAPNVCIVVRSCKKKTIKLYHFYLYFYTHLESNLPPVSVTKSEKKKTISNSGLENLNNYRGTFKYELNMNIHNKHISSL